MDYTNQIQERHSKPRHVKEILKDVFTPLLEERRRLVFDKRLLPSPSPAGYYKRELGVRIKSDIVRTKCPFPHSHIAANVEAKHGKNSLTLFLVNGGFYCRVCKASGGSVRDFQMKRYGFV